MASAVAFAPAGASTGWRGALVGLGVKVFACSHSLVSHAGAHGEATWAVAVDTVHLLLVGPWAGEVFIGAYVLPPTCADADRADRTRSVQALSSSVMRGSVQRGLCNVMYHPAFVLLDPCVE